MLCCVIANRNRAYHVWDIARYSNSHIDIEYNLGAQPICVHLKFADLRTQVLLELKVFRLEFFRIWFLVQSFRLETVALKSRVSRLGVLSHLGLISSRLGSDCGFAFRIERVKGSRLGKAFTGSCLHSTDLLF